ncbi:MAG: hypothetical protein Q3979_03665 [Actinomycetaceae bacterium]|nr:hypothetical protein [Actinomycetaceae bacterium]
MTLAAGLTRRTLFELAVWQNCVYAAAAASLTLLGTPVLTLVSGDFSGQLLLDGAPRGNLWLLPLLVALGVLQASWVVFALFTCFSRFPWYLAILAVAAIAIIGALVLLPFGLDYMDMDSNATRELPGAFLLSARFFPSILMFVDDALRLTFLSTVATLAGALPISWLSMRGMPIRK